LLYLSIWRPDVSFKFFPPPPHATKPKSSTEEANLYLNEELVKLIGVEVFVNFIAVVRIVNETLNVLCHGFHQTCHSVHQTFYGIETFLQVLYLIDINNTGTTNWTCLIYIKIVKYLQNCTLYSTMEVETDQISLSFWQSRFSFVFGRNKGFGTVRNCKTSFPSPTFISGIQYSFIFIHILNCISSHSHTLIFILHRWQIILLYCW